MIALSNSTLLISANFLFLFLQKSSLISKRRRRFLGIDISVVLFSCHLIFNSMSENSMRIFTHRSTTLALQMLRRHAMRCEMINSLCMYY